MAKSEIRWISSKVTEPDAKSRKYLGAASHGDLAMVLLPDETHVRTPIMASLTRRRPRLAPF